MTENFSDIQALTFENAMAELEQIIHKLEDGKVSLEESVNIYNRGVALKKHCDLKLSEAEEKVEKILIQKDGSTIVEPFEE